MADAMNLRLVLRRALREARDDLLALRTLFLAVSASTARLRDVPASARRGWRALYATGSSLSPSPLASPLFRPPLAEGLLWDGFEVPYGGPAGEPARRRPMEPPRAKGHWPTLANSGPSRRARGRRTLLRPSASRRSRGRASSVGRPCPACGARLCPGGGPEPLGC